MRNVSPAVIAALDDRSSDPMNVPALDPDHKLTCVYVSVVETLVHSIVAVFEIAPEDAAPKYARVRVVFVAGLLVPAAPGSPRCSFTHTSSLSYAVPFAYASSILLRSVVEIVPMLNVSLPGPYAFESSSRTRCSNKPRLCAVCGSTYPFACVVWPPLCTSPTGTSRSTIPSSLALKHRSLSE